MSRRNVAFQGELGAYSEMAARHFFGSRRTYLPCPTFETVFRSLDKGTVEYGVIPIVNSLTGSIHENYDLLMAHGQRIAGEVHLRISHALIALPGTRVSDLQAVYSHPQAIAQCRQSLQGLRKAEIIPAYDTAGSVKMIREKKITTAGAIASIQAAIDYKMAVLRRNLESNKANYTRFFMLGPSPSRVRGPFKTSLVFGTKNVPGALFKSLAVFAMRDIDLLKIESRPLRGKSRDSIFYLDFLGHEKGEKERNALQHLTEITKFIRILGSYPVGKIVNPKHKAR